MSEVDAWRVVWQRNWEQSRRTRLMRLLVETGLADDPGDPAWQAFSLELLDERR